MTERKKNLYFFLIAVDLLTPIQNVVNTCDQWEFSVATTILKENICFYNFENEVDNRVRRNFYNAFPERSGGTDILCNK